MEGALKEEIKFYICKEIVYFFFFNSSIFLIFYTLYNKTNNHVEISFWRYPQKSGAVIYMQEEYSVE